MTSAKKILAERFRFVDDVLRAIEKIGQEVDVLLGLQHQYIKQTAAGLSLKVSIPTPKNSPKIPESKADDIKIVGIEKLRKNYAVVRDLWEAKESLELMEVKVRQSFAGKDVDTSKAVAELAKLKRKVELGLSEAFGFLKNLADNHLPAKFAGFNRAVFSILQTSIAYESSTAYSYVYEVDGDLCFSTYVQLSKVMDDDGTYYPELYIVTTYRTGSDPSMYIATLSAFAPPSSRLMMKRVATVKETVRALNMLLALDNFTTSIGSLPIAMMLKGPTIDRSLFMYQNHVLSIRIDEEQVVFTLKPEIQDKSVADKIIAQIYKDFQGVVRKTNAKIRMGIKQAKKCFVLTFFFVTPNDTLLATESDLDFLRSRFQLSDTTMKDVLRVINSGSPL